MATLEIDCREKDIIQYFSESKSKQLSVGDIHVYINNSEKLLYVIERKTLADLAASIKDGRYKEQKSRLIGLSPTVTIIYIIEGTLNTTFPKLKVSGIPTSTLQTCILQLSLQYKFTVIQTENVEHTCQIIQKMVQKAESFDSHSSYHNLSEKDKCTFIQKEQEEALILQNCGKKKSKKLSFISMLCQIPGVSLKIGTAISNIYPTMNSLCVELLEHSEPDKMLEEVLLTDSEAKRKRRLGPVLSKRIYTYLHHTEKPSLLSSGT
tara:strand:- start:1113 stop:1907 length:795 start_codon:yes stop_codon:yes gene_type:complete